MAEKESEILGNLTYAVGIASIVFGIVMSAFGLGLGITGFVLGTIDKTSRGRKGKKLSIIGVVVSIIVIAVVSYLTVRGYLTQGLI